ncbi:MAG: hypothetical protein AB1626_02865 [Candidatus Micrarchaeota archaeon]
MKFSRREFFKKAGAATALAGIAACARKLAEPIEIPVGNKKLKIVFQFGKHETAVDARQLEPVLRDFKPHVVSVEWWGVDKDAESFEKRIYSPLFNPDEEFAVSDFSREQHRLLKQYRPRIFVLERMVKEAIDNYVNWTAEGTIHAYAAIGAMSMGDAQGVIDEYRQYLMAETKSNALREAQIKSALSDLHDSLTLRYPELAREKEIRIAVQYGSAHTPIYEHARRVGFGSVGRKMLTPAYYPATSAFVRRATFGKPQDYSDAEVARTFTADMLLQYAKQLGTNDNNSAAFGNLFAKKIGFDKFHRIFASVAAEPWQEKGFFDPRIWQAAFAKHGVKLPASKEEVHAFLEKRIGRRRLAPD